MSDLAGRSVDGLHGRGPVDEPVQLTVDGAWAPGRHAPPVQGREGLGGAGDVGRPAVRHGGVAEVDEGLGHVLDADLAGNECGGVDAAFGQVGERFGELLRGPAEDETQGEMLVDAQRRTERVG